MASGDIEFTIDRYRSILRRAVALDYWICPFRAFDESGDRPVLILRHDLDHAIEPAVTIAEVEAELGVSSTFFVQTNCAFYNLLATEARDIIKRIVVLGHEIGLHYDSGRYVGPEARTNLRADVRLLEDLSGQPIKVAAQHIPIDGEFVTLSPEITMEAYEARFTEPPMNYISDSLMAWRQARPDDLLDAKKSFQFLSHPENWTEGASNMKELLDGLMRSSVGATAERFTALAEYYGRLLAERVERDLAFRSRRSGRTGEAREPKR